ncbi:uncharacterized protein B0H18DRAFT_1086033 [Fomitopsis serialis]|uniref:uncharacterized protein n=1 Tax=Fomitopsis serialis TaxID=139415 RepID=UPI002008666A|nr:uncharacterized protein B0H18DRAFT_1086033 [Neoantrodia serialis]KAH9921901.1 hypothetical protein B0H18DRAFT_1086033 [Neoantrodia serialis]
MARDELPSSATTSSTRRPTAARRLLPLLYTILASEDIGSRRIQRLPPNAQTILSQCAALHESPGPPTNFLTRETSDRFEPGTQPTLIRNATIWTGAWNGTEVIYGDVYLDKGIVRAVGHVPEKFYAGRSDVVRYDAEGAWVTPGLVDLHSHVGLFSAPFMRGAFDVNSRHGPVLPWLRSIDAFNTHDDAFMLAIAGGVTSVQVLPGSGNAIGGQAFMFKLRKTSDRSPTSMILEPPHSLNGTEAGRDQPMRWRHMNVRREPEALWQSYGCNLVFRSAYNEARKIKLAQDAYCVKAEAGLWEEIRTLVDVLRGRVKIANHCYEEVDLDDIVRLTNEFQFPIASFHHASEAWLVPDLLKRTWGGTPAIAIFATNHRYKRESYRGSEFAPRVLADNGIPVVLKSDHPVLNSRYLLFEAQQAHYFGLPPHLALSSVTAVPATAAGMSHRIGVLQEGADADLVLWDSHPLQLGATPRKVWIDGILQVGTDEDGVVIGKGKEGHAFREVPSVPSWDEEREEAVKWEGLPPLDTRKHRGRVVFKNVREVVIRNTEAEGAGKITCAGKDCRPLDGHDVDAVLDLYGGSIMPGIMSFGSPLGTEEIAGEPSTGDGALYDPFYGDVPTILGDEGGVVRAADAMQFGTRNALLAHRGGVTYATSSLEKSSLFAGSSSIIAGLSVTFRTGSAHALEHGAIIKDVTALHVVISRTAPFAATSRVSITMNGEPDHTETGHWFEKAAQGAIPLVVEVASADIMATLLKLKDEIAEARGSYMKMVFFRATEAHLIAGQIAEANVGVILEPARPFPQTWDDRRILAGPPLTNDTSLVTLMDAGVTVAVGIRDAWQAVNTRFETAWAALESNGRITKEQARALVSTNLEKLLGVQEWVDQDGGDLVAYQGGGMFDLSSKPVAVVSSGRALVDLL